MSIRTATTHGPHVYRHVSAVWEINYRWGPNFGDDSKFSITRGDKTVSLNGFRGNESFPPDVARQVGEALIAAAEWSGEQQSEGEAVTSE